METKLNGYTLKILPDDNPKHPRRDCDHLGTLLAWHRRYDLGDNNNYSKPDDFFESEEAKRIYASLPVYMLDHSGLYHSTTGFADIDPDRWDWGRLGIIYCTEEQAINWLGEDCTPERATKELFDEIKEYDTYLNSRYYGFTIEGLNGEHEDSCWGFLYDGDNQDLLNTMKEYVSDKFHPLFDKLAEQADKRACM